MIKRILKKYSTDGGSIVSGVKAYIKNKKNEKMLPELEKKVAKKQRSNIIDKLVDTGSVTGADKGTLKYIPKKPKESNDYYWGYNELGEYVKMRGKKPSKLK